MGMKLNMNELSSNLARKKKHTHKRLIDHKRMGLIIDVTSIQSIVIDIT